MTILNVAPITCAICKATFGELEGAACKQCRRILCRKHFFRDSLKDEECFVRNVSRKTLRLVTDLKNSGSDLFFTVPASQKIFWYSSFFFRQFFRGSAPFPSYVRNLA